MMTTTLAGQKKMCLHKRLYDSRAAAKRIARQTQRGRGREQHRCRVYQCTLCGYWHVTSQARTPAPEVPYAPGG